MKSTQAGCAGTFRTAGAAECDPLRPPLAERPLISVDIARELARTFKVLANDTRLRLLHELSRVDRLCVTDLAEAVGLAPQAVSNQLQRLVDRGTLGCRREGSHVFYWITDPCLTALLEFGLCLNEDPTEALAATRNSLWR